MIVYLDVYAPANEIWICLYTVCRIRKKNENKNFIRLLNVELRSELKEWKIYETYNRLNE